jgi:hypothetical protein
MIEPKDIGRPVIYRSHGGDKNEAGIICGLNSAVIFVRYAGRQHLEATYPRDLEFIQPATLCSGGSAEQKARHFYDQVLAKTSLDPSQISNAIDQDWTAYLPLVVDAMPVAA